MPFTKALPKKFRAWDVVHKAIWALVVVVGSLTALAGTQWGYAMAADLEQQALGGDLKAQRELADCLTKGCSGTAQNRALACAWRIVVVASGQPGIAAADIESRRLVCENLSPDEQKEATGQARSILKRVYGRELVLPADFFGGPARAK